MAISGISTGTHSASCEPQLVEAKRQHMHVHVCYVCSIHAAHLAGMDLQVLSLSLHMHAAMDMHVAKLQAARRDTYLQSSRAVGTAALQHQY